MFADDLRAGWDNHLQFARENPGMYRLMWSPAVSRPSRAAEQAQVIRMVLDSAPRAAGSACRRRPPPASSWPPSPCRWSRNQSCSVTATMQSRLNDEQSVLTDAERLLMQQWLSKLADAPPG
jgi:hypothetical protein